VTRTFASSYLATYRNAAFGVLATYLTNLRAQLLDHRSLTGAGSEPSLLPLNAKESIQHNNAYIAFGW
jgi:hypothetical protein